MSRYIVWRGKDFPGKRSSGGPQVLHTDNAVEALLERNLLRAADGDGTSWNATTHGLWQVVDTSVPGWPFLSDEVSRGVDDVPF